ncbi:3-hydroxyacyl-CoA dehydrogenase NAD-binding domain-containing protein [Sulfuriroseicoccus oceanibius]|uniref:enoyl-CoA hydratase n=1 Tax=Sulfuriroseicoccus oceanibius TaxID=2707525 RepID=A0A6B3L5R5_9BACT|nr:3-hydroxyacyl-CoA dehydrogenase NAD-binding domain-containing protein [Sulfuriroseicoccus oceanibius]QQL44152.1 enoyl-CoA hydratase/isomerase family protein [Sulfuriroseicoccus oceanibius]
MSEQSKDVAATRRTVHYAIDAHGVVTITFKRDDGGANRLDEETIHELEELLAAVEGRGELSAVLIRSEHERIFVAGADIKRLAESVHGPATDRDDLKQFIRRGQALFDRVMELPVPTVAMVHGACLGGGLELALACDWRVASVAKVTKLGLPETQLGILPAWGGCMRLPRLIGIDRALAAATTGKQYPAKLARKLGIVDLAVEREHLDAAAMKLVARGKRERSGTKRANLPGVRTLIGNIATNKTKAKTRGNYPAVERVIEVMVGGLTMTHEQVLAAECEALCDLASTNACRNLLHLFFLREGAKQAKMPSEPTRDAKTLERVGVIGAGIMGAGIAQWSATRGHPTVMRDVKPEALAAGMRTVNARVDEAFNRRLLSRAEREAALARVTPSLRIESMRTADLVIEAAVESLDLKCAIFKELADVTEPGTILATNTSALPVTKIAEATSRPNAVLGIHFFNPVHRMSLVELVHTEHTDPDLLNDAFHWIKGIGKVAVVCADRPGFVVNRILMPYLIEAGHLFSRGTEARLIDETMLDFGMPMGPLRLLDEVGLDVALHVAATLSEAMPGRFSVPRVLQCLVDRGALGRKSGAGFYLYGKSRGKRPPEVNPEALQCRAMPDEGGMSDDVALRRRLSLLMCNEAMYCLEEKVVADPESIDLAMVLGTGFAPFLGGPLRHCDTRGVAKTAEQLQELYESTEREIFKPCALMANTSCIFKS